jgi:hypothetical protein
MSKQNRILQTETAKTNWREMAKILFVTEENQDEQIDTGKQIPTEECLMIAGFKNTNQNDGPFHNILILMVIVSVAEKRTQEIYESHFAERCNAISVAHDLKDDHYWPAGKVPVAYEDLNAEFERCSNQILIDTLREYDQNEIADLVQKDGPEQIFNVIQNAKSRYLDAIRNCSTLAKQYFGK